MVNCKCNSKYFKLLKIFQISQIFQNISNISKYISNISKYFKIFQIFQILNIIPGTQQSANLTSTTWGRRAAVQDSTLELSSTENDWFHYRTILQYITKNMRFFSFVRCFTHLLLVSDRYILPVTLLSVVINIPRFFEVNPDESL